MKFNVLRTLAIDALGTTMLIGDTGVLLAILRDDAIRNVGHQKTRDRILDHKLLVISRLGLGQFRRAETAYGSFRRAFRLPEMVNVKAISAELTDGILRVALPFDTDKVGRQHIEVR